MVLELRQQQKKELYSTDWRQTHKNKINVKSKH